MPGVAPNMSTRPPDAVLGVTIHRRRSHSARDTMPARLSSFAHVARQSIRKEAAIRCTAGRSSTGHPQSRSARRQGVFGPPLRPRCQHVAILGAAEDGKPGPQGRRPPRDGWFRRDYLLDAMPTGQSPQSSLPTTHLFGE